MSPYPKELASTEMLRDGSEIALRAIHPGDERLLHDLAAHMTPEDLRLRFFTPVHDIPPALAVRLTHIDYDHEMALVALHDGAVLGVARYAGDPERRSAEFAIAVRSDWHGRGVGYVLMNRLIAIARQRGIGELVGEVLRDNRPMLAMCRELGFSVSPDPAEPNAVRVRLALTAATPPPAPPPASR